MKYLTLSVIKCGLRRALELFECSGSSSASPLLSLFKDALLRQLPDVKTLISLHHNIVKKTISKQQPPAQGEIPPELALREKGLKGYLGYTFTATTCSFGHSPRGRKGSVAFGD